MELQIPSCLTKEFVTEILQNDGTLTELEIDEIVNLEIDKPVAKGNNYVCDIFRVKVKYTKQNGGDSETSLIVKAPMAGSGDGCQLILETGIIQKEVKIYAEYLPKVEQLFKQYGVTNSLAKSYRSCLKYAIIMEDLKSKGFKLADRINQLDYEHCGIALTGLAKFHAASVKLYETEKELIEDVGRELIYREDLREKKYEFLAAVLTRFTNDMKTWPVEYGVQKFIVKLEELWEKAWDILVETFTPKDHEFNVLNHGDFWVSNMLFKYNDENDSKTPIDVKLLDLQVSRWASPALDLRYFINGSVQEDVRSNRLDDLLEIYLKELNSSLEKFDCKKRLEEPELKIALQLREFFGLFVNTQLLPIIIAEKDAVVDMRDYNVDDFKDSTKNPFASYLKNEKLRRIYSKRLIELEKKGWF